MKWFFLFLLLGLHGPGQVEPSQRGGGRRGDEDGALQRQEDLETLLRLQYFAPPEISLCKRTAPFVFRCYFTVRRYIKIKCASTHALPRLPTVREWFHWFS